MEELAQAAGMTTGANMRLHFERMDEMLEAFNEATKGPVSGTVERGAFAIGLLGAGVGLIGGALAPSGLDLWLARGGLLVEIGGLLLAVVLNIKREWRSFRYAKREYAQGLDRDYAKYREYVTCLCAFPRQERNRHLRYIRDRRRVMQHRLGLFTGGLERLGVLPLIVALYLQFKDWEWGDWAMLAEVNLVQGLLIWALLLGYAAGWQLILLYGRAEAYELLLAEAAAQDDEATSVSLWERPSH